MNRLLATAWPHADVWAHPNLILLAEVRSRDAPSTWPLENHAWWKYENGERAAGWEDWAFSIQARADFQDGNLTRHPATTYQPCARLVARVGQVMPHNVIIGLPQWQTVGPAIFAERLVRGLAARGHDAKILLTEAGCNRLPGAPQEPSPPDDLPCDRLPAGPDDTWGQRWEALERYLEERAPCFYLMLHDWRNNVIAPRLSRRVRLIGLVQADGDLEIDQAVRLGRWWDALVAVSDPIQFKLVSLLPHLASRAVTIRNAVPAIDCMPPKPTEGPLRIASSGELRRHPKRLDDMAEIARRLADRGTDFQLTFFGDGPHRDHLEETCRGLSGDGLVTFAGRLGSHELLDALAGQHVFLLTSEFEGLSIAMLEAMSRGCVPVVSRLASQSLVVRDGVNGLTADVGDVDAFVTHLARLATDRPRLATLASRAFDTIAAEGYRVEDMIASYLALFDRVAALGDRDGFVRQRRQVAPPPQRVAGIDILPGTFIEDVASTNGTVPWPSGPSGAGRRVASRPPSPPTALERHRVIVAANPGNISGVDVFAMHLVRGLRNRGIDARLHGPAPRNTGAAADRPPDLPCDERDAALDDDYLGWLNRWRRMVSHLVKLAPCIYVPNYDADFSCVAPLLPDGVRVVGIGHSDDPWHYEHLCRIGHACDAIVGVSHAISDHLRTLAPEFAPRVETIPYGITPPLNAAGGAGRSPDPHAPLRIIYTGRLVGPQKRALDLVAIARALEARGIPYEMAVVGDGDLRGAMQRSGHDLVRHRRLWFTGSQPNAGVLALLETSDVFLLPSAYEGLSVAMLEAMSRGVVPLVSAIRSGVPEVIKPGENGLVAPVGDITAFADRLEWLWRNPDDRARLASAAVATVAGGYLVEHMIDSYVRLFRRIIADPIARPVGAVVPPRHLRPELTWSLWASRVAADPAASLRRIVRRARRGIA